MVFLDIKMLGLAPMICGLEVVWDLLIKGTSSHITTGTVAAGLVNAQDWRFEAGGSCSFDAYCLMCFWDLEW